MLLRFGVSNFLSFKEYQELSLVASTLKDEPDYLLSSDCLKEKTLPCIAIYGANASGKSNLLKAFAFFRSSILQSHFTGTPDSKIPRTPFLLDSSILPEPSAFDCDFILNGVRYHYGFSLNDNEIVEEWLYSYPERRRNILFQRNINEDEPYYFGRQLKGPNKAIAKLTRKNSLFLSAATQNNHEILAPIYKYFSSNFRFRFDYEPANPHFLAKYLEETSIKEKLIDFLKLADVGIVDSKIEEVEMDDKFKKFTNELNSILRKFIEDGEKIEFPEQENLKQLKLGHSTKDGKSKFLNFEDESLGTLCLLSLMGPILNSLEGAKTILVDEIDSSIHPLLVKKIIQLFGNQESNPNGAQLIFTTHDTNLLCCDVLRRDEIWFTEKSDSGASQLNSLTDIKTRSNDNLQKGYLQGRYGAIPFLGNLNKLFISKPNNENDQR